MTSQAFRSAVFAAETGEVMRAYVTIAHASLDTPIRVCDDLVPADEDGNRRVSHGGESFVCCRFEIDPPAWDGEQLARAQLRIANVTHEIVEAIRRCAGVPQVTIEMGLASDPDGVEVGPLLMNLVACDYDAVVVSGELSYTDTLTRVTRHRYRPADFPGLF